jgi:hypothetical protein
MEHASQVQNPVFWESVEGFKLEEFKKEAAIGYPWAVLYSILWHSQEAPSKWVRAFMRWDLNRVTSIYRIQRMLAQFIFQTSTPHSTYPHRNITSTHTVDVVHSKTEDCPLLRNACSMVRFDSSLLPTWNCIMTTVESQVYIFFLYKGYCLLFDICRKMKGEYIQAMCWASSRIM